MSFQNPGAMLYTQGFGSRPENVEVPHLDVRNPSATDILYPIGKRWINTVSGTEFFLPNFSSVSGITSANWVQLQSSGGGSGVQTLSNGTTPVSPNGSGNIAIDGTASQITVTSNPGANNLTLSLASPMVLPGNLTVNGDTALNGAVTVKSGTSDININSQDIADSGSINIGNSSSGLITVNGPVDIGNVNQQVAINTSGTGNTIIGNLGASTLLLQAGSGNVQVDGILEANSGSLTIGSPLSVNAGLQVRNNVINPPSYTQQITDVFLDCATSAPISIQLINAVPGTMIIIADTNGQASANPITVVAPLGQSIIFNTSGGVTSYDINVDFGSLTMIVASNNYYVLAQG